MFIVLIVTRLSGIWVAEWSAPQHVMGYATSNNNISGPLYSPRSELSVYVALVVSALATLALPFVSQKVFGHCIDLYHTRLRYVRWFDHCF